MVTSKDLEYTALVVYHIYVAFVSFLWYLKAYILCST